MFNKLNNPRHPADPQKAALVAKQSRVLLALEDLARNNKPLQSLETADDQDIFGSCRYYYRERLHWHQTPPVLPTSENDLSLRRLIHKVMDCQVDSGIIMHTEFEVRRALVEAAAPGAIAARLMDTYEIAMSTFNKYQHRFYEALFPDSVKAYNWSAVKELYKSQQTLVVRVASSFSLTKPGGRPKSNNTNRPQKLHGTMLNTTAYTSVVENMDRLVWQNPDRVADFANSSAVVSSVSVTETHGIAGEQQTTMGTNTILRPDSVMLETMEKRSVVSASVLRKALERTKINKSFSIKKRKALTETTNAAGVVIMVDNTVGGQQEEVAAAKLAWTVKQQNKVLKQIQAAAAKVAKEQAQHEQANKRRRLIVDMRNDQRWQTLTTKGSLRDKYRLLCEVKAVPKVKTVAQMLIEKCTIL